MTPTETKYVEKLKEYIEYLKSDRFRKMPIFESEISALESEMEKEKEITMQSEFDRCRPNPANVNPYDNKARLRTRKS